MKNKIDKYLQDQRDKQEKYAKPFSANRETLNNMSEKLTKSNYTNSMWKKKPK